MGSKIKGLAYISKAVTAAGVIGFRESLHDLLDDIVRDGGEEDAKFGLDIGGGINARGRRAVILVELIGNHQGAIPVETALVEL